MTTQGRKRQARARGWSGERPWRRPWSSPQSCQTCGVLIRCVTLRDRGTKKDRRVWVEAGGDPRGWVVLGRDDCWWFDVSFEVEGVRYRRHKCHHDR